MKYKNMLNEDPAFSVCVCVCVCVCVWGGGGARACMHKCMLMV
jgi:hypothetical protein